MMDDFARGLLKTLTVLRPYLPQIVIGGGWAPFLYYRYLAKNREHTPVLTRDIDFMVGHQVPIVGPQTIDEILTKEAKLTTAFKNLDNPAVIHYEGTIDGVEVEIEFLTDQTGSQEERVLIVQKGQNLHTYARILPCKRDSNDRHRFKPAFQSILKWYVARLKPERIKFFCQNATLSGELSSWRPK